MDLTAGQRTFSYVLVNVNSLDSITEVPFYDSAGNLIKCNYIHIDLFAGDSAGDESYLFVEPSGISAGNAEDLGIGFPTTSAVPASGICGFSMISCARNVTSREWFAPNGDEPSGLKLYYRGDANGIIAITYGTILPRNVLRSKEMYDRGL